MLFINHTWEIFLHVCFNLASTLPAFFSKVTIEAFLQTLGLQFCFFCPFTVANSHGPFPSLFFFSFWYFYNLLIYHVSLDSCHMLRSHLQVPLRCNIKLYKKGLMPEHQKCFILPMHRLRCWKETVVFCAGTCLCNISREFIFIFCFPHCCHFPSASLYFTQRLRFTVVLIVENSSSWVLMNVWMKLYECHMVCSIPFVLFFFFLTFLYELFVFELHKLGQEFEVALMEILQCTQLPSETTAALRLVHRSDLWTFTHRWSVKSQYSHNQGWVIKLWDGHHWPTACAATYQSADQCSKPFVRTSRLLLACATCLISWEPRTCRAGVRHAE